MEIEKTRETSWKIQLKNKDQNIEITSVEISGEVRIIRLALLNKDTSIRVEMKKEEFFNLLSLISAFKDVVIGEEFSKYESDIATEHSQNFQDVDTKLEENYQITPKSIDENYQNKDEEGLNPEEWDPW